MVVLYSGIVYTPWCMLSIHSPSVKEAKCSAISNSPCQCRTVLATASQGRHTLCQPLKKTKTTQPGHALNISTYAHSVAYMCVTHTLMCLCTYVCAHLPVHSLLCMSLPKAVSKGLPGTLMIISQTVLKASRVHFCFKHACTI